MWDGVFSFKVITNNNTRYAILHLVEISPRRMILEAKQFFDHFSSFHRVYIYIYFLSLVKHIITTITIFLFSYRKMLKRLLIISRHDTRWSPESYGEESCRGHFRKLICFATHPRATLSLNTIIHWLYISDQSLWIPNFMEFVLLNKYFFFLNLLFYKNVYCNSN